MDEQPIRSSVSALRSEFRSRAGLADERVAASDEMPAESDAAPASSRRKAKSAPSSQFSGAPVPAQFKLPADLLQSLKLHSIDSNETMSEIVLRCLTSTDLLEKAWISTRKAS